MPRSAAPGPDRTGWWVGASGFAGFYPAGTELDPVTVTMALDGAALPPAGTRPGTPGGTPTRPVAANLAQTGGNLGPLVGIGAALVLAGGALLVLRRRARAGSPA